MNINKESLISKLNELIEYINNSNETTHASFEVKHKSYLDSKNDITSSVYTINIIRKKK